MRSDTGTWHVILDTWYLAPALDMLYLTPDPRHLISDTGWYVIRNTWYLTLNIWRRYLTCYHLTSDTWYMTLGIWHAITHLTCFYMVLVHLTWYCDTWLVTVIPGTCIILHINDHHFYGDLAWLLYCDQTFGTCGAPIPRVRRHHCDVYTQVRNTLTYIR